nr:MAG TPA: lipoprotein [Caudoviricetes sp.]
MNDARRERTMKRMIAAICAAMMLCGLAGCGNHINE